MNNIAKGFLVFILGAACTAISGDGLPFLFLSPAGIYMSFSEMKKKANGGR